MDYRTKCVKCGTALFYRQAYLNYGGLGNPEQTNIYLYEEDPHCEDCYSLALKEDKLERMIA